MEPLLNSWFFLWWVTRVIWVADMCELLQFHLCCRSIFELLLWLKKSSCKTNVEIIFVEDELLRPMIFLPWHLKVQNIVGLRVSRINGRQNITKCITKMYQKDKQHRYFRSISKRKDGMTTCYTNIKDTFIIDLGC